MNNVLKYGLIAIGAGAIYRAYSLYQLGEKVQYTPASADFKNGKLIIKMKLENPTNASVKMKGVDGYLRVKDNLLATFKSAPFTINASGVSYFDLIFNINSINMGIQIVNALIDKNVPNLNLEIVKKIGIMPISETMAIDLKNL